MPNEPQTLGEVVRRVDAIERRQERNPDIYLSKEVYFADRRADAAHWSEHDKDHDAITSERNADAAFRRQVLLWGAGLTITTLVTVALYVASILGRL